MQAEVQQSTINFDIQVVEQEFLQELDNEKRRMELLVNVLSKSWKFVNKRLVVGMLIVILCRM